MAGFVACGVKGGTGFKKLITKYAVILNILLCMICILPEVDSSTLPSTELSAVHPNASITISDDFNNSNDTIIDPGLVDYGEMNITSVFIKPDGTVIIEEETDIENLPEITVHPNGTVVIDPGEPEEPDEPSMMEKATNLGAIIGSITGVGTLIVGFLTFYFKYWKKRKEQPSTP